MSDTPTPRPSLADYVQAAIAVQVGAPLAFVARATAEHTAARFAQLARNAIGPLFGELARDAIGPRLGALPRGGTPEGAPVTLEGCLPRWKSPLAASASVLAWLPRPRIVVQVEITDRAEPPTL